MSIGGSTLVNGREAPPVRKAAFVYVILFFLVAPYPVGWMAAKYFGHLAVTPGVSLWKAAHYFRFTLWFSETLAVFIVCEVLAAFGRQDTRIRTKGRWPVRHAFYGAVAGIVLAGVTIPILLRETVGLTPASLLVDDFYSFRALALALLVFLAIPITSEYAFRGVIFGDLKQCTGFWAAAIGSSVLFGYLWPIYGFFLGFLLGMVTAFLYDRTNSLLSCISANVVFTITSVCFVAWRHLSSH